MRILNINRFPEEGDLVVCVVKKIFPYGAICTLIEYDNLEAFLHISEIAPRWIKNIHEFISEGTQYVVRVWRVNKDRGQVDISLKRVNEDEKRRKLEEVRQAKRAEKLLEFVIKSAKSKASFENVKKEILKEYEDLYSCFEYARDEGIHALDGVKLSKTLKHKIVEVAKANLKKSYVSVSKDIKCICYGANGVSKIKEIFDVDSANGNDANFSVLYLGAPKYRVSARATDYKKCEKLLSKVIKDMQTLANKYKCTFEVSNEDA